MRCPFSPGTGQGTINMFDDNAELIKLVLTMVYGLSVAIVFFHASYTGRNLLVSLGLALIPFFGFIIYFTMHYVEGAGNAARRAKHQKDMKWEFVLTDKGKKKNPNEKDEETDRIRRLPDISKSPHIKEASPPSNDLKRG